MDSIVAWRSLAKCYRIVHSISIICGGRGSMWSTLRALASYLKQICFIFQNNLIKDKWNKRSQYQDFNLVNFMICMSSLRKCWSCLSCGISSTRKCRPISWNKKRLDVMTIYCNDTNFSYRQVWANIADPDQTEEQSDQVFTVCYSNCIISRY